LRRHQAKVHNYSTFYETVFNYVDQKYLKVEKSYQPKYRKPGRPKKVKRGPKPKTDVNHPPSLSQLIMNPSVCKGKVSPA